jgi:predicted nucleic acid-binding protein
MRLYLDVCCLNRPFDDQTQDRIHLETEAVLTILKHVEVGDWTWVSSSVVLYEVNNIPNSDKKHRILKLCDKASEIVKLDKQIYSFSKEFMKLGFKSYDALHLSCAKKAGVNIFLSTDDKLVKKAYKNQDTLNIKVDNPLHWLQEVL